MRTWSDRYTQAQRHAVAGRRVIDRQRKLINQLKALGRDTRLFEEVLASFERSQLIFEDDLVRIASQGKHVGVVTIAACGSAGASALAHSA